MSTIRNAKRVAGMCSLGTVLLIGWALADIRAHDSGHLLSDNALAAVFGDGGTFECKTKQCDFAQGGSSNCEYCDATALRVVCCDGGEDECTYTGGTVCENTVRKTGSTQGTGSCDSCSSANFSSDGFCTSLENASCS